MIQQLVTPGSKENKEQYHWTFSGRVMVVDNGSRLALQNGFKKTMELDTFAVVSFDPLNKLAQIPDIDKIEELQIIANTTLGTGYPISRYDCLNDICSATLKPLPETLENTKATDTKDSGPNVVLVQPAIASIALDCIEGLSRLDWFLLDEFNDNASILQNGSQTLQKALLIDVRVPFQYSHEGQADFTVINHFLSDFGFRFYRFHHTSFKTDLPKDAYLEKTQFSDTITINALFLPTDERLEHMAENDLLKLGFLLHTIYKCKDTAYKMLSYVDEKLARDYLIAEGFLWPVNEEENEFTLTESYSPDIWANELAL